MNINGIAALKDNYIWALTASSSGDCVIVDPGDAAPVIEFLDARGLNLKAILITHHHWDHTNGVATLAKKYSPLIFRGGPEVNLLNFPLSFKVIKIPGHTLDHVAYYTNEGDLFCGDTLFAGGCGRAFEGSFEQLYQSLQTLARLPLETKIFCGHEYTQKNLHFAQRVEPKNSAISQRLADLQLPSLPSTLALEKATNPFLRCHVPDVKASAENYTKRRLENEVDVFTVLRQWKDKL